MCVHIKSIGIGMPTVSHIAIRESLLARIRAGEWPLGARIPDEVDLAEEYGCARATVNRALRALASRGLVVRKRKGGTRVSPTPVRRAEVKIPLLREQVESTGAIYGHKLTAQRQAMPPDDVRDRLGLTHRSAALYLETIHLSDERPFAFEIRWVNTDVIPDILDARLDEVSANEWLVQSVPFSAGDVAFSAVNADPGIARVIGVDDNAAIFLVERTTWLESDYITTMKLFYRPGYKLVSRL